MKIGFFTYGIDSGRTTGIARYAIELSRALKRLEPSLEIILLNPYPNSTHPWYQEFETYPLPSLKLVPFAASLGNIQLHRAAIDLNLDILHDPCSIAPFIAPNGSAYKRVVTVHDAIPAIYPKTQPLFTHLMFNTLVRAAAHTADAILTVSQASAEDLHQHYKLPKEKLHVTYNAYDAAPPPCHEIVTETLQKYAIHAPFFLFVSALHPRKNIERVIEAFQHIQVERPDSQLVITGPPYWGANETLKQVQDSAKDGQIIFTGFVSDEALQALYSAAQAFVFPSLYEGFGLPVLEAMACGTPVLTSNTSSLPEVAGDAALLVDPTDTAAIADAMVRLLTDAGLHAQLSEKGLDQAKQFTWQKTARETLDLYKTLLTD